MTYDVEFLLFILILGLGVSGVSKVSYDLKKLLKVKSDSIITQNPPQARRKKVL